jgi:Carboxypeptidase regulatory-like domain
MTRANPSTRRLYSRALTILVLAGIEHCLAAQLPNAPIPQISSAQTPAPPPAAALGTLAGTITDSDGASLAGARVTLTTSPPNAAPRVAVTASDGRFTFSDVPAGPFQLSVWASAFAPRQSSGELQPGESRELPYIAMTAATSTNIQVTATQTEIAEAQINQEEKQRVLGVFPNFYVSYDPNPVPLSPGQKLELAARTLIDPVNFVLNGITAGVQQADNTYNWGQGAQGYAKRYAAAYGTFLDGTLIGSAGLPILLKQDPRYFYKGTGSVPSRAGYAVAAAVICKGDNHHWQFNYSAIIGGLAAGAISNLYYPASNRAGLGLTFEGAAIGTGMAAVANLLQEFVVHKLTPHVPPPVTATP